MKWINKRSLMAYCVFSLAILISGCSVSSVVQTESENIPVYYHADDGEWNNYLVEPTPENTLESAKESGKTIIKFVTAFPGWETSPYVQIVNMFNNINDRYYVEMEVVPFGAELGTARTRIATEIATGGGPDVIMEEVINMSTSLLEKGTFVDLTPLLEKSEITSEKYFPGYASIIHEGKIYGVCPKIYARGFMVYERVINSTERPSLEQLLDCLLDYQEKSSFIRGTESGELIMSYFLNGSENLWGMIDWENRSCDFSAPVFSKILQVSKKYMGEGYGLYAPVMDYFSGDYQSWKYYEFEGKVYIGYYFDDGCHMWYQNTDSLLINSNTKNLEGAYAFVSYVMSKEAQNYVGQPVHRGLWEERAHFDMELVAQGRAPGIIVDEDIIEKNIEIYDDARYLPRNTEMILDIVYEESGAYFAGDKSIEDVVEIIQNRVNLYLNE